MLSLVPLADDWFGFGPVTQFWPVKYKGSCREDMGKTFLFDERETKLPLSVPAHGCEESTLGTVAATLGP